MTETDHQPQRVWSPALAHAVTRPVIVVVMGVSGSGKSTVAALLAAALGCQFQEGDDLHPPANVAKMSAGLPSIRTVIGCSSRVGSSSVANWLLSKATGMKCPCLATMRWCISSRDPFR